VRVIGYEVLRDVRDVVWEISGCEWAKPRDLGAKSQVLNTPLQTTSSKLRSIQFNPMIIVSVFPVFTPKV